MTLTLPMIHGFTSWKNCRAGLLCVALAASLAVRGRAQTTGGSIITFPGNVVTQPAPYTIYKDPVLPDHSSDYTLTVLHHMGMANDGTDPRGTPVRGADGNFYGTTRAGGANGKGTVYRLTPDGTVSVLHSFGGKEGTGIPVSLSQGSDGNLYGTAGYDGVGDYPGTYIVAAQGETFYGGTQYPGGVAFRLALDGTFAILHNFNSELPNSLILGRDGILYGTTSGDSHSTYIGSGNYTVGYVSGTFFSLASGSGTPTILHNFYGYYVRPGLIQGADGMFYGAIYPNEGSKVSSAIFSASATGTVTLSSSSTTGSGATIGTGTGTVVVPGSPVVPSLPIIGEPNGDLVQGGDGVIYGTSLSSGSSTASGSVFRYTPADGKWGGLFNFPIVQKDGTNASGASPLGGLALGGDGFIYGTTEHGGAHGLGTIFRLGTDGTLATAYSFTGAEDGSKPAAGLVPDGNGGFYGCTSLLTDGTAAPASQKYRGTVFRFSPVTGTVSTVHGFASSEGANPAAGSIPGHDGMFYGVTTNGGTYGGGTFFSLLPDGQLVTLFSFKDHGTYPYGLIPGSDGNFYGADSAEVFRFTPDGAFSTVGTVAKDQRISNNVIQGSDGNFYGTTIPNNIYSSYDGTIPQSTSGTVFMMTPGGALTTLHQFAGNSSETNPDAGLTEGSDGNFYGTNSNSVFKITPAGELTTLAAFKLKTGGISPYGVFLGSDGNLHGSYSNRGGRSVAYSISTDGVLTNGVKSSGETIHTRNSYRVFSKKGDSELIQGGDGLFYGTSFTGGPGEAGTVFRMTLTGERTILHSFHLTGDEGYSPGGLAFGGDGALYGATTYGGPNGQGAIFKLAKAPPPIVTAEAVARQVTVGSGKPGKVMLMLPAARTDDLTVRYVVKGNAQAGVDYELLSGVATIQAGSTATVVKVTPMGDLGGAAGKTLRIILLPDDAYDVSGQKAVKLKLVSGKG